MLDENRISERAHAIWESAGKPDGAHHEHWQQARREMEAEDGEAMSSQATVSDMPTMDGASQKTKKL